MAFVGGDVCGGEEIDPSRGRGAASDSLRMIVADPEHESQHQKMKNHDSCAVYAIFCPFFFYKQRECRWKYAENSVLGMRGERNMFETGVMKSTKKNKILLPIFQCMIWMDRLIVFFLFFDLRFMKIWYADVFEWIENISCFWFAFFCFTYRPSIHSLLDPTLCCDMSCSTPRPFISAINH